MITHVLTILDQQWATCSLAPARAYAPDYMITKGASARYPQALCLDWHKVSPMHLCLDKKHCGLTRETHARLPVQLRINHACMP